MPRPGDLSILPCVTVATMDNIESQRQEGAVLRSTIEYSCLLVGGGKGTVQNAVEMIRLVTALVFSSIAMVHLLCGRGRRETCRNSTDERGADLHRHKNKKEAIRQCSIRIFSPWRIALPA